MVKCLMMLLWLVMGLVIIVLGLPGCYAKQPLPPYDIYVMAPPQSPNCPPFFVKIRKGYCDDPDNVCTYADYVEFWDRLGFTILPSGKRVPKIRIEKE